MSGHVEHDAARDDGRHLLDAELGQPGDAGEVAGVVAVVVGAVRAAEMPQAVKLRPDSEPALEHVVVVGGVRERAIALLLVRLHHLQHQAARREGRRRRVDDDAEAIRLAGLDELRRRQHGLRRDQVGVADFVVRAPARWLALLRNGSTTANRGQQCRHDRHSLLRSHVHLLPQARRPPAPTYPTSCRGPVGATLVVARLCAPQRNGGTGDHKGRPYAIRRTSSSEALPR